MSLENPNELSDYGDQSIGLSADAQATLDADLDVFHAAMARISSGLAEVDAEIDSIISWRNIAQTVIDTVLPIIVKAVPRIGLPVAETKSANLFSGLAGVLMSNPSDRAAAVKNVVAIALNGLN